LIGIDGAFRDDLGAILRVFVGSRGCEIDNVAKNIDFEKGLQIASLWLCKTSGRRGLIFTS